MNANDRYVVANALSQLARINQRGSDDALAALARLKGEAGRCVEYIRFLEAKLARLAASAPAHKACGECRRLGYTCEHCYAKLHATDHASGGTVKENRILAAQLARADAQAEVFAQTIEKLAGNRGAQPTSEDCENGQQPDSAPKFGDLFEGTFASESNPRRRGRFVREIRRTGKLNPGVWYELTDGNGSFWEYKCDRCTRVAPQPDPRDKRIAELEAALAQAALDLDAAAEGMYSGQVGDIRTFGAGDARIAAENAHRAALSGKERPIPTTEQER